MINEELCYDLDEVVAELYHGFTWYEPEKFTKRDIKKLKLLSKELIKLTRKIK